MDDLTTEQQFRKFLTWIAIFIFIGVLIELSFIGHYEVGVQYVPFVLSAVGILVLLTTRFKPSKGSLLTARYFMGIVALGSILGMSLHIYFDIGFIQYQHPGTPTGEAFIGAVTGGLPLLAPGILLLAGVLGIAATYKHPRLKQASK